MINALIFFAHFVFALIVFTKKWQDENLSTALLNLGLVAILFSVGWSITTMLAKAIMEPEGLGIFYDRDSFSLTVLTLCEIFFYRIYYKDTFLTAGGKEKL